jgi:hypothetical protein
MKKILFLLFVILFVGCDTPYKIIETYKTDSTGATVKTVQKLYSTGEISVHNSIALDSYYPFFYPRTYYYGRPYYQQRPIIVTPTPRIYTPRPYIPRGRH